MRNVIIGTAGHIDHGKTSLIKVLTGKNTDSLDEEKKRGISINLGFAFFDLPSNKRAGIIDVPGHEKFIKNMLAGATGIDVAMLVISCEEGIKPQTREHLDILSMLNIPKGIIILTKRDLVDDEWVEFIKEDIRNEVSNTFLKDAKMIEFSAKTKLGYEDILTELDDLVGGDLGKIDSGFFRMPIDRCFTVQGFGTIVTGTVISGKISVSDSICIYPSMIESKVRNIQVYEEDCKEARAGQRCALNLANVKKEDIERGFIVSVKDLLNPSYIIDCKFKALEHIDRSIVNRQRIRLFHGSSEIIGRIYFFDCDEIRAGEESYVQFHLEKPITCLKNDRYVIRMYSPMTTVGGGYIINPLGVKVKGDKNHYIESLKNKEKEFGEEYIEGILREDKEILLEDLDICKKYSLEIQELNNILIKLCQKGLVICFEDGLKKYYIHIDNLEEEYGHIKNIFEDFHKKNRFKLGFFKEELRGKLRIKNIKIKVYEKILNYYEEKNLIKVNAKYVCLADFDVNLLDKDKKIIDNILNEYRKARYIPPRIKDLETMFNNSDFIQIHEYLEDIGCLYRVNSDMFLLKQDFEFAKETILNFLKKSGAITLKDAKDLLNSNRKYLVYLLEHLDELKVTKRVEDTRVIF